ncbi:SCP-like protein [Ostertagia ostertagi]
MNDRIRVMSLTMHNYRRSRLAQGLVADITGKHLPSATNMIRLRYKCSLETSAKAAVDRCSTHGSYVPYGVQQNIASVPKSVARYRVNAMAEAVKGWWSRVRKDGGIGERVFYRFRYLTSSISWFTRMAWATTEYIGCAVSQNCGDMWYVACHYSPGGNKLRHRIASTKQVLRARTAAGFFCDSTFLCEARTSF